MQDHDYLRKRGEEALESGAEAMTLRALLKAFFPLCRPSEIREVHDLVLAKHGVGPWAKGGGAADERRNELRALFDLFDVDGRGRVDRADLRRAVAAGGGGLAAADAADWPILADALEARLAAAGGDVDFAEFARVVERTISNQGD